MCFGVIKRLKAQTQSGGLKGISGSAPKGFADSISSGERKRISGRGEGVCGYFSGRVATLWSNKVLVTSGMPANLWWVILFSPAIWDLINKQILGCPCQLFSIALATVLANFTVATYMRPVIWAGTSTDWPSGVNAWNQSSIGKVKCLCAECECTARVNIRILLTKVPNLFDSFINRLLHVLWKYACQSNCCKSLSKVTHKQSNKASCKQSDTLAR